MSVIQVMRDTSYAIQPLFSNAMNVFTCKNIRRQLLFTIIIILRLKVCA